MRDTSDEGCLAIAKGRGAMETGFPAADARDDFDRARRQANWARLAGSSSKEFLDETHSGMALLALIDALRHLYHGYRFHNDLLPKGFAYSEQHFKDVSKKVGWPLAIPESVINEFGYAALSQGKTSDAIGLFKRNVEANPNSANAYDSLADGYAKAGQWKDAVEASEKAVALAIQFSNPKRSYFIEQAKKMKDRLKQAPGPSK